MRKNRRPKEFGHQFVPVFFFFAKSDSFMIAMVGNMFPYFFFERLRMIE